MAEPEYTGNFKVEYAKSAKGKCFACKQQVDKDALRIGAIIQSTKFDGTYPQWHHETCFEDTWMPKNPGLFTSSLKVSGMNEIRFEDQKKVQKLIKTQGDEEEGDASMEEETELDKEIAEESKKLWEIKTSLKHLTNKQMKDLLEHNNQPHAGKIFGGAVCLERIADGMLFGALPKCDECEDGDFRFSSGEYKCTGNIDAYTKCTNILKDISRTPWKIPSSLKQEDGLKGYKYKKPKKDKITEVLEVEKRKRDSDSDTERDSAYASSEDEDAKKKKIEKLKKAIKKPKKGCFAGLRIGSAGKLKLHTVDKLKKIVETNNGTFSKTAACDYMVTTETEADSGKKKVQEAINNNTPLVSEEWVTVAVRDGKIPMGDDLEEVCIENMPEESERDKRKRLAEEAEIEYRKKELDNEMEENYTEATRAPVGGKTKVKVKGGAAVELDSGLVETGHVMTEGKEIYAVTMNRVDISTGRNSYYILQLIVHEDKKQWSVFRKWGKVGTTIGDKKLESFPVLSTAKRDFCKQFSDKTGNTWEEYIDGDFEKKPGLMEVIDIDYGDEEKMRNQKENNEKEYKGDLHATTQELIRNIFDIRAMEDCLLEMEIDTNKMPLGNLSKTTLKKGLQALTAIQDFLKNNPDIEDLDDNERRKVEARLVGLSNQFYTKVPLSNEGGPEPLDTMEKVKAKNTLVSNLLELEIATNLMEGVDDDTHPIDHHYSNLKCDFKVVPKKSKTFKTIYKYLQNTHATTHDMYTLELEALWEIDREDEAERFEKFENDDNRKLLWHGSRITNWGGILSQGLRIAPPEAPTTGYMFGKGVYFADMSSKSANYCYTTSEKSTGVLVLCEVALGKMMECTEATYVEKLPKGKLSCFGKGRIAPNPKGDVVMDNGTVIPCGKPKDVMSSEDTSLQYNEFIVYDVNQVRMKYLLQVKFHYNKECGTFF
eukprot:TRINITY_DN1474_c0_g1_i4.p1 TRINITY_DN1474_c0_g1~~TRINITY_DN1474_c0_g1_i4.p1  ORF type:complete len:938 (+),score=365.76 TRINITY_DN1474_c0_g1_i4:62-2875(+)